MANATEEGSNKKESRLANRKVVLRRVENNEAWLWEWAVMEFVRQWIAGDGNWSELAQNNRFGEAQVSVFRKAYSVARGTVSTGEFKKICEALRGMPEWLRLEQEFSQSRYLLCWTWLSERLGITRRDTNQQIGAWSAASKYLWLCFPEHVALYDANACHTLSAWNRKSLGVTSQTTAQAYLTVHTEMYERLGRENIERAKKALDMHVPYDLRIFDKYLWLIAVSDTQVDAAKDVYERQRDMFRAGINSTALFAY